MQNVMTVESDWLPRLAAAYCEFNAVKNAEPRPVFLFFLLNVSSRWPPILYGAVTLDLELSV